MIERIETNCERVVVRDVRVLDVRAGSVSNPTDVPIENGVIAGIGVQSPASGRDIIEGGGLTLAPGLIDCHCHILSPFIAEQRGIMGAWVLRQIRRNLEAVLACGVVCVRDLLSPIKFMNRFRRAIASGRIIGPRILASGPILSCAGGYPEFMKPVPAVVAAFIGQPKINLKSPRQADAIIRRLHGYGINVVKVGYTVRNMRLDPDKRLPTISKETLEAVCETAHSLGLKVSAHHFVTEDLPEILACDIDSLEHLPCDREMNDDEIELVRSRGVTVAPTLTMGDCAVRFEEKSGFLAGDRAVEMFEPRALEYLKRLSATWLDFSDPEYLKSFGICRGNRESYRYTLRSAARLHGAGVRLCAGTDMGAVTSFPGETADEVRRLNYIGLSRLEALRSATLDAARLLGIDDKLGSIEPGKDADVILIDGNPLEDLDALRRVRIIGKGGRWFRTRHPELPDFWHGFSPFMEY